MSGGAHVMRSRPWRLAPLVTAVFSCVSSTGRLPPSLGEAAVSVERDVYRVARTRNGDILELTIVATFTNRTADTVVLHPCSLGRPAVTLEKWVGGEWRSAFDQVCPDILVTNAPRLAPGERRTDTAWIFASLRPDSGPRFELGSVPGLYRVVYSGAHRSWRAPRSLGPLLPKDLRVSNPFRVVA